MCQCRCNHRAGAKQLTPKKSPSRVNLQEKLRFGCVRLIPGLAPLRSCGSGGGLAGGTAAAAGSCWAFWRSQECSASSPSRVLCCRLCLTSQEKERRRKTGMERSGPTPSALRQASWQLTLRDWHMTSACCCCGTRPLPNHCWTYVRVGLYRFALCASRRQLRAWPGGDVGGVRSWTGSSLSTPLAANFRPGPEALRNAARDYKRASNNFLEHGPFNHHKGGRLVC